MHRAGLAGLVAAGVGVVMVAALDLLRLDEVNPLRRTISEHGLGPQGWLFAVAVGLLAAGSAAIGLSLARRRLAGVVGTLALMAWSAGLFVVAVFPKHDWSVGPSLSGSVHRVGSIVAFLALPLAALVIARPWRHPARPARVTFALGVGSLLWVAGIASMIVFAQQNGLAWWRVMPLGLVERGLAVTEVATLIALGVWAALPSSAGPVAQAGRSIAMRSST